MGSQEYAKRELWQRTPRAIGAHQNRPIYPIHHKHDQPQTQQTTNPICKFGLFCGPPASSRSQVTQPRRRLSAYDRVALLTYRLVALFSLEAGGGKVDPDCSKFGSILRHGPVAISELMFSNLMHASFVGSQSLAPRCPLSKHHLSAGAGCT